MIRDTFTELGWRWWRFKEAAARPFRALKALLAEVRAPLSIVRCDECGHYFDAADHRGVVFKEPEEDRRYGKTCPACHVEESIGAPAWAAWNGCQGVFADVVFHHKAEVAVELQRREWPEDIATVVPVRVFKEREDRVWHRERDEEERVGG